MPTLSEYFAAEARDYLGQLRATVAQEPPAADALHRSARGLRGSAQMAREERVYRAALALESAARAVAAGTLAWTDALLERTRGAVVDLAALVERTESESALDSRLGDTLEGWRALGVELPAAAFGDRDLPAQTSPTGEFRAYAAREIEGVSQALEQGIADLGADPMDREALKRILRRHRALLGSARLDEIPVVAEILRAVEDLTRVIAKLDVGVKQEWLDVYRVARDALRSTLGPLRDDQDPGPNHSLARLRHMRAELMDRYGAGEAVSAAAAEGEGLAQVQSAPAAGSANVAESSRPAPARQDQAAAAASASGDAAGGDEVVPIQSLEYRGEAAVQRALELRTSLEAALRGRTAHLETLEELFDLIRLARE